MAEQTVNSNDLAADGAEGIGNTELARLHWAHIWEEELLTPLRVGLAHSALCQISDLLSALQTLLESGEVHALDTAVGLIQRRLCTLTSGGLSALSDKEDTPEAIHARVFGDSGLTVGAQ